MNNKTILSPLSAYIREFSEIFPEDVHELPWQISGTTAAMVSQKLKSLSSDFRITGTVAIHKSAVVEENVILKGPLIISKNCFVAAHAYLRNGVYLGENVMVGPGCELKSTLVFSNSSVAHFNYVGDSLVGSHVNMEAGAVVANTFNERALREIEVIIDGRRIKTGVEKFGALIGDGTKIGANAVLSPGTILPANSIVARLELVAQDLGTYGVGR